jgi:hypothetical protein
MALSYDERMAVGTLRKALIRSGRHDEIIAALLKDMPRHIAVSALRDLAKNLNQMLEITRAFQLAAAALSSKIDDQKTQGEPNGRD